MSEGDLAEAVACWTDDAVIIAADGSSTIGRAELEARFDELIAAGAALHIEVHEELIAGDVAYARTEMVMRHRDPDAEFRIEGNVVYRLVDGRWRIAIDRISPHAPSQLLR